MPSVSTLRILLVLSGFAWAAFPFWGAFPFLACLTVLSFATWQLIARARQALKDEGARLGELDEAALRFAHDYAVSVVWPDAAKRWGDTWNLLGPLAVLEAVILVVRALVTASPTTLGLLALAGAQLIAAGGFARYFNPGSRLTSDLSTRKPAWDTLRQRVLQLADSGGWPPRPAPDDDADAAVKADP